MTSPATRILLVEDSAVDAALFQGLLKHARTRSFSVTHVETLAAALDHLHRFDTDLIVLDLGLPDSTGLDSLRQLQAHGVSAPVLVLTASEDETLGIATIHEGAQDYIPKSHLETPLLIRSIGYSIERHQAARQAEDKARSSEAQLRQFIEDAPVKVAMLDRDMRYLAASQGWMETYGRGHRDLHGLSHYEVHPDIPERWKQLHRRGLAGEFLRDDRDRWVLGDGTVLWLRWAIHPWRDPVGDIGGIIISVEDITERVKTEEALLFTENLMRETGRIAKVGGWELDVVTGKGYWTEEVARIHELDSDRQPTKESGLAFYLSESRARIEVALKEAIEHATPYDLELELLTAKGNRRWIRTISHPILEDGKVTKIQGSFQDITDRKLAEDTLRRQASLIDQVYDAVFVWERGGTITFWNRAAERIYGFSKEQAIGQVSHELLKTSCQQGWPGVLETLASTGKWEGELEHTRRDGQRIVVESRMVQIAEGDRTYVLETNRDVSDKRLLEEQLRQAVKMEAIGRLAGGVAHDFNNLLGVILGCAELLFESTDWNTVQSRAAEIQKAGQRAANLTRQLLAFSRKQVLEPKVLDLNAKLSEMTDMLERIVGEDVSFSLHLSPDLGSVRLDPGQLEQVILNLVVNARDAMPHGGKIVIETQNVHLDEAYAQSHSSVIPGRYIMIAVSDSGIGMDLDTQARVFEPFFTTKPNGTGLGLATVYGAVIQSGGHIWLYSERGRGTIFKIYFPRVNKPSDSIALPQSPAAKSAGSETVLLVEDSESLRDVTKEFLEMAGYNVLDSCNGQEALCFARGHAGPIHLLLTDVVMPGLSGPELARDLQQLHPETRVLFMSGYTADAMNQHGVLEEGLSLLPKPFTRSSLTQKIRDLLDS
jgi:two-component system, cell cycle sensor histidine kinase and response regulator CckA